MHRDAYADRPAPTGRKMLAVAALAAAAVAPCGASPTAAFQLPTGLTSARLQFAGSATSALAPSRRPAPRVALGGLHAKAESRGPLDHLRGAVVAGAFLLGVLGGGGVPDVHAQGPPTPNGARPAVSVDVQVQGDGAESPSDLKIRDATGKFFEILKDLDSSYVDTVDIDKLSETAFQSMLTSLDPYTEFENVKVAEEMKVQTFGNYGGVGLVITKAKDATGKDVPGVKVVDAFEGYAYKQGMRAGDLLLKVGGQDVTALSIPEVSNLLKGPADSSVNIEYKRPGVPATQQISLPRKAVVLRDVPLALTIGEGDQKVAYAKLRGFSSSAAAELFYVLNAFQKDGPAPSVILDLRGNGGGLLNSAIKVSDLFLSEGQKVVSTRGRILDDPSDRASQTPGFSQKENLDDKNVKTFETIYNAEQSVYYTPPLLAPQTKVVVLIDRGTASAAEIVAGAIQDHDRGLILGETSYGKGLVQQLQRLGKNGQQIKFTVGKYYTPSGRCIQSKSYKAGDKPGSGTTATKFNDADRKVFFTDSGRTVKDAGGIEPDVFVKSSETKMLSRELYRRDAFYQFADVWQAKHAADGEKLATTAGAEVISDAEYNDFKLFVQKNTVGLDTSFDKNLDTLEKSLKDQGFTEAISEVEALKGKLDGLIIKEFDTDKTNVKRLLASVIKARYLPDSAILQQSLENDPQIEKALAVLRDSKQYTAALSLSGNKATTTASATPANANKAAN